MKFPSKVRPNGRSGLRSPEKRRKRIKIVQGEDERNYDSDVKLEIDMTNIDDDSSVSEFEVDDINTEKNPQPRHKQKFESAKSPSQKNAGEKKFTSGRPAKSKSVSGQIKSIFQLDDEMFKTESTPVTPAKNKPKKAFINSLLDINSNLNSIPIVSGIKESTIKEPENLKFEPLPVPKKLDQEYIEKYFDGIDPNLSKQGRFLEDRVFFLEGPEGYFEQHQTRAKSSTNSLTTLAPNLEYPEFNKYVKLGNELFAPKKNELKQLHQYLYHQWLFELNEGFNLNFYGVGSKIDILNDFVTYSPREVLVVNGYNPQTSFKKVLGEIASYLIPDARLPKHISELVPFILENKTDKNLLILIHNIDAEPFRDEKIQNLFSQLVAIPEIWCLTSTDHINAPLLWDSSKLKNLNFIWHDLTTFQSYIHELSFKDVLNIGKSKKFIGNLGAKFVLDSLTKNHRNVYKVLLQQQMEEIELQTSEKTRNSFKGCPKAAVDFKKLYNLCLDDFVVSNEVTFRTLLKEYIEHKMCSLVKDSHGSEMVFIPFTYDEMQKIYSQELI